MKLFEFVKTMFFLTIVLLMCTISSKNQRQDIETKILALSFLVVWFIQPVVFLPPSFSVGPFLRSLLIVCVMKI